MRLGTDDPKAWLDYIFIAALLIYYLFETSIFEIELFNVFSAISSLAFVLEVDITFLTGDLEKLY